MACRLDEKKELGEIGMVPGEQTRQVADPNTRSCQSERELITLMKAKIEAYQQRVVELEGQNQRLNEQVKDLEGISGFSPLHAPVKNIFDLIGIDYYALTKPTDSALRKLVTLQDILRRAQPVAAVL